MACDTNIESRMVDFSCHSVRRGKDAFVILLLLQGKHQLFPDWIDFSDEELGMLGIHDQRGQT